MFPIILVNEGIFGVHEHIKDICRRLAKVDNPSYCNVLRDQHRLYEGRDSGSRLRNPDFKLYAKNFGVPSWRVTDAGSLRSAVGLALAANSPALIEVITDITQEFWPWEFIAPGRG